MMPTRTPGPASTPGVGDTPVSDDPIPKAGLGTDPGGLETFLLTVVELLHDEAADPEERVVPVERVRRRDRRRERQFARAVEQALVKGETTAPVPEPESLAEYLARVEAPLLPWRSRRSRPRTPRWLRRTAKVAAVGAVLGACVAAPWVAPAVPGTLADLVPGHNVSHVEDPPVTPSSEAFTGPIGVAEQEGPLSGVRLPSAGQPREVVVPRLHVDSEVVPISGQSGSLLPPSDPQVLGWWKEGRWPGAGQGTAVITGHTVHTGGGALDHLDQLVVGDSLRVRTDNGWIRYVVQRARIYSTAQLARDADQIFRLDGPGRLVVITCDGWNGVSYDSNAIVIATPVGDNASAG
jgi:LPXTG-site transpeptidase (sortase) family protein